MKTLKLLPSFLFVLIAASGIALAQQTGTTDIPRTISYQGMLTSGNGTPLTSGSYDITVTLYADAGGIHPIWHGTYRTNVQNGLFNLYIGSGENPLPDPATMNRPLWIGTSVNGEAQMIPLTPLTSSPYALNLPDNAVTTSKLADGAVTAGKMGTPYVAGIAVNGKSITGDGTVLNIEVGDGIAMTYDETTRTLRLSKPTPATQGDPEKRGVGVLAGTATDTVWSGTGDLWDITGGASVSPTSANWIGTSNNVEFTIKVNDGGAASGGNQRVMQYLPNGTSANILGGHNSNFIGNGVGNVIAGGGHNGVSNTIANNSDYGVIGGGDTNVIANNADWATISGGHLNRAESDSTTVSGGAHNVASGAGATVSGGDNNTASAIDATVGGGDHNIVSGIDGTIAGGCTNTVTADDASIGGGDHNTASGVNSRVGGGEKDTVSGANSTIGGGIMNKVSGTGSTIGGGDTNIITGNYSFIGGGRLNTAVPGWGAIAGGDSNIIQLFAGNAFIGSGEKNKTSGSWSVIGGGRGNIVLTPGTANFGTITGGDSNIVDAQYGFVGGGYKNKVTGYNGMIGSGSLNVISGHTGTIGGGRIDTIAAASGFVGGGDSNAIRLNADFSAIGGGVANKIDEKASYASIGGGNINTILAPPATTTGTVASMATIPGGDNLIAQSWAQTVMGGWNETKGSIPFRYQGTSNKNEPILIVGNGSDNSHRTNAFEVSYNGHSIVYDQNGTGIVGVGRGTARGATYNDNIIYAWGTVSDMGSRICTDFGVNSVQKLGTGHYRIKLNPVKESGNQADSTVRFECTSITATLTTGKDINGSSAGVCKFITTTLTDQYNYFDVYITEQLLISNALACREVDGAFTFKVTGRLINR